MHACRAQLDHKRERTHLHLNQLERVSLNERGESHRSNDSRGLRKRMCRSQTRQSQWAPPGAIYARLQDLTGSY